MNAIAEIISEMGTPATKVNPTEIFNEGWMTRLLMHYSVKEELKFKDIGIDIDTTFKNKHWTSEALISSPFVSAKSKREGYTHPDIAIGDFKVDYSISGKLEVEKNAKVFGIIEAKMKSPLSKRTSNAKEYNQASRTVACIATNAGDNCQTFFYVVLPESKRDHVKRDKRKITDIVTTKSISDQIKNRVEAHNKVNPHAIDDKLLERVGKCKVGLITYEHWINQIKDTHAKTELDEFYANCKKWNNIK